MDFGDIPTWVAAGLSAVFGILAWRSSSRAKNAEAAARDQATRALQAAEEAAAAGKRSADAAERSASALENQHRLAVQQADAAEGVPWEIRYRTGSKWELWNVTETVKFSVTISGSGVMRGPTTHARIDGHSSEEFWGNTSWQRDGKKVQVTWHRRDDLKDEPRSWSGNLTPKLD